MAPKYNFQLADSEQSVFEELRDRIATDLDENVYDKNDFIYRFLKSKHFNVDDAEKALKNVLRWRRNMRITTILTDYKQPEVLQKHFTDNLILGIDKSGHPVFYLNVGKLDVLGFLSSLQFSDIEKEYVWVAEKGEKLLYEQSTKLNKRINSYTFILDVENLSFATAINKKTVEMFMGLVRLQLEHYPQRIKAVYVINATSFFTIPYNIIKNYLSANVMKKVTIFGLDGWKEKLRDTIDADQLPAFLGGKKTDPDGDPLCKTLVFHGSKVNEKYYNHKTKKSLAKSEGVKRLVLSRASFSEIKLEVDEDGCAIEWEWEIKVKDVGFGLFYQESVDRITELVPLQRLDTDGFPETGVYKCEKAGTYIMLFDNSYSWIRSKEVYYKAKVVNPDDLEKQLLNK